MQALQTQNELSALLPFLTKAELAEIDALTNNVKVATLDGFKSFVAKANPRFVWYPHCEKLARVLIRVANGEIKRLLVSMPPRHSKSEQVSRLFSAYYLTINPHHFIGLLSYGAELANTLSRNARDNFEKAGGEVKDDAGAVKHWETTQGGGMWAAGVGGAITGKGFHLGIIDDPLKNSEDAASVVIREKQKEWYSSTFYTRAEPDAAIIIIQTRWHDDDLTGWLLTQETEELPEHWHIVNMPAIKEETVKIPDTCTLEPDNRKVGDALCPQRYPIEVLQKTKARLGSYYWSALYQQNPQPREGGMFKRDWFEIVKARPDNATRFIRYWDKAGTEGGQGARTAGVLMCYAKPFWYVCDVIAGRWSAYERENIIKQTAELDGKKVEIWIEQEPGSGGKESAEATIRNLAGYRVHAERPTGDKVTRAEPFAAQCEGRNVKLVRADWNYSYLDELTSFPTGATKDKVDASSGAFNHLAEPKHTYNVSTMDFR